MTNRLIKPPTNDIGAAPYLGAVRRSEWSRDLGHGSELRHRGPEALRRRARVQQHQPRVHRVHERRHGAHTGNGYWLFGADGSTYPIGTAPNYGDLTNLHLNAPIVTAQPTPDHKGYWMLGSDGGVFSFGDAHFHGSTGNIRLVAPVNSFAHDDRRRWLLARGVRRWRVHLRQRGLPRISGWPRAARAGGRYRDRSRPERLLAVAQRRWRVRVRRRAALRLGVPEPRHGRDQESADGQGYYILRSDGAVDSHGDARRYGDLRSCGMTGGASHMIVSPTGNGYWIVTKSGEVLAFGDARPLGMPGSTITAPASSASSALPDRGNRRRRRPTGELGRTGLRG